MHTHGTRLFFGPILYDINIIVWFLGGCLKMDRGAENLVAPHLLEKGGGQEISRKATCCVWCEGSWSGNSLHQEKDVGGRTCVKNTPLREASALVMADHKIGGKCSGQRLAVIASQQWAWDPSLNECDSRQVKWEGSGLANRYFQNKHSQTAAKKYIVKAGEWAKTTSNFTKSQIEVRWKNVEYLN